MQTLTHAWRGKSLVSALQLFLLVIIQNFCAITKQKKKNKKPTDPPDTFTLRPMRRGCGAGGKARNWSKSIMAKLGCVPWQRCLCISLSGGIPCDCPAFNFTGEPAGERKKKRGGGDGKKKIITVKLQSHSSRDRECVCDVQRARFYGLNGISISSYYRYDILYYSCNAPAGTCIVSAQQWAVISSHFMVPYTVYYHCNIRGLSSTCVV